MPGVILASASPRRRELLAALVPSFEVASPDIPETLDGDPIAAATTNALAKASAIANAKANAHSPLVIAADTIVFDRERSYGKPADALDAGAMLRSLRGRAHSVVTAVAVAGSGRTESASVVSRVTLAPLTDSTIVDYVASGRPLDKAGAYAIQDDDVPTVAKLEGCYCNVMGLPLWCLRALLGRQGVAASRPDRTYARCAGCPERLQ